jgi:chromosome segregation ATPase
MSALQDNFNALQSRVAPTQSRHQAEVAALQQQIDLVNRALQTTRSRLATKEEDVDRLQAEIRVLRSTHVVPAPPEPCNGLMHRDVSATLPSRSSVVARAVELQRSDDDRAEAMRRLEAERQAYLETLQGLRETFMKFYAS